MVQIPKQVVKRPILKHHHDDVLDPPPQDIDADVGHAVTFSVTWP
jgi:hypothetical protein